MQIVPLRPGVTPEQAQVALLQVLHELDARLWEIFWAILSEKLSGEIAMEQAEDRLVSGLDDLEDEAREKLAEVMEGFWDFTQAPGGPIGVVLESLDGPFWEAALAGLGTVARNVATWVRDALTLDDLKKAKLAHRLLERAERLDQLAVTLDSEGKTRRAEAVRRRASRKRARADKLTGA